MRRPFMPANRQRGQAIVEYLILFPTMILLILGAIQFALLYQVKSTLDYAAFIGARQGALENASMLSIKDGVASGLTPLFTYTKDSASSPEKLLALGRGRAIAWVEVFNPLVTKVQIVNPTKAAFDGYKAQSESGDEIPNDNLMYRSTSADYDGMSIQDANLLKIRVTYCAKLIVPFANQTIYALYRGISGLQNLAAEYFSGAIASAGADTECQDPATYAQGKIDDAVAQINTYLTKAGLPNISGINVSAYIPSFTIPVLNWNIGGIRIPLTAEAVVRMQSPVHGDDLN